MMSAGIALVQRLPVADQGQGRLGKYVPEKPGCQDHDHGAQSPEPDFCITLEPFSQVPVPHSWIMRARPPMTIYIIISVGSMGFRVA